jgi:hypothetical protein
MKRKSAFIIAILGITIILFYGCTTKNTNKEAGNSTVLATNNKTETMESKSIVTKENVPFALTSAATFVAKRDTIQEIYGKADISRDGENYSYEIRNIKDGSKLFVVYSPKTDNVNYTWHLKKLLNKDKVKKIIAGKSTFDDVKKSTNIHMSLIMEMEQQLANIN